MAKLIEALPYNVRTANVYCNNNGVVTNSSKSDEST
jgi:hypothetical protein